jgi:hypothetical protein
MLRVADRGRTKSTAQGWLRRRRCPAALVVVALAGVLSACGSSGTASSPSGSARTVAAPLPAGPVPSPIATMVCTPKAQRELAKVLGVTATVDAPAWVAHRYSCRYRYPDGSFTLSVKELSSWPQTLAYFHALGGRLGDVRALPNLGQGAFQTTNGSVVVRKDWKVLLVDVTQLPGTFGVPPTTSGDVAVTVADVILGCWNGD